MSLSVSSGSVQHTVWLLLCATHQVKLSCLVQTRKAQSQECETCCGGDICGIFVLKLSL